MNRRPEWLLPAIVAVIVVLAGVIGILVWLVVDDSRSPTESATSSTTTSTTTVTPTTSVPTTVTPSLVPTVAETSEPPTSTVPPRNEESRAPWYAQFGAFDDRSNAEAERARHVNTVVLPGSEVGSSSAWVVVRPAATRAEAEDVCAKFAEGGCYVKESVQ